TDLARRFLEATADLPAIAPRTLYRDPDTKAYLTDASASRLAAATRKGFDLVAIDETFYYTTKYGSPLAYVRPLEVLGRDGVADVAGRKVLDFGYGTVEHLRLLASLSADATG